MEDKSKGARQRKIELIWNKLPILEAFAHRQLADPRSFSSFLSPKFNR
jgi:hypothetical protein